MKEKIKENLLVNAIFDNDDIRRLTSSNVLEELYDRAYNLVSELFKDKKDKSRKPYIEHLIRVSEKMDTTEEKIVALLHDTLEDTFFTEEDLKDFGFPEFIIESVKLLTKPEDMKYKAYIKSLIKSKNKIALKVKLQDMIDNRDENRLKRIDPFTAHYLRQKYDKVLPKLTRAVKRINKGEENDRY